MIDLLLLLLHSPSSAGEDRTSIGHHPDAFLPQQDLSLPPHQGEVARAERGTVGIKRFSPGR
ncbi:MAG: hypothetical protein ABFS21_10440 [Actinomycetota bacterium]